MSRGSPHGKSEHGGGDLVISTAARVHHFKGNEMRIKMLKTSARPEGVYKAGKTYVLRDELAAEIIASGDAAAITNSIQRPAKTAKVERAVMNEDRPVAIPAALTEVEGDQEHAEFSEGDHTA